MHETLTTKDAKELVAEIAREGLDQLGGTCDRIASAAHLLHVRKDVDNGDADGLGVRSREQPGEGEVLHELVVVGHRLDGLGQARVRIEAGERV